MSGKQLTLFVTFHIDPSQISAFKEAHRPVWAACAQEPECLYFDVFHDPAEPGKFRFVEVWGRDRKWFEEEQLTKEYYTTLWPKSQPTWLEPAKIEYFEREGEGCVYREEFLEVGRKMG